MIRSMIFGIVAGSLAVVAANGEADARTVTGNSSVPYWYTDSNGNPAQQNCLTENNSEVQIKGSCPDPGNVPIVTPLPVDGAGYHTITWVLDGIPLGQQLFGSGYCFAASFTSGGGLGSGWFSSNVLPNNKTTLQSLSTTAYVGNGANFESVCYLNTTGEGLRMVNYTP
jgi:hypothetical protein